MATIAQVERSRRAGALATTVAIHLALIYLLATGLGTDVAAKVDEAMALIEVGPPPPPPVVKTPRPRPLPRRAKRPEGEAAPPNLKSVATPVVAPPPVVRLPVPSPVTASVTPGAGVRATAGAAEVPGPGTGAGGVGDGRGSGGDGDGDGGGGDGGDGGVDFDTPPRELMTELRPRFYPDDVRDDLYGRSVEVRYRVGIDGRVTRCRVTRSSRNPGIDAATCPAIERHFRWRPPLDRDGRPMPLPVVQDHFWEFPEDRGRR